jgi:TRAP-type C4-dicarboxylate transport system permease small subunit
MAKTLIEGIDNLIVLWFAVLIFLIFVLWYTWNQAPSPHRAQIHAHG